ncbi:MAG: DUF1501 domain-containing protein [Gemmataceae bacterium]|nr:DUF1501 domain-containing protein [Gemmataceae bacterium]
MPGFQTHPTRRAVIRSAVGGALLPAFASQLLAEGNPAPPADPLAPKKPHFAPKANRVIVLFSSGGVSQMDTFDPKPKLMAADGKQLGAGGGLSLQQKPLLRPRWAFKPGGKCGTMVSDLFPHLRDRMDDICLVRSMSTDNNEHYQASLAMHTGSFFVARPSLGAWVGYGLGTVNRNLPAFVVIAPHLPYAGGQVWANDFLPAHYQGTRVVPGADPVPNVRPQPGPAGLQELELGLANSLNAAHLAARPGDTDLAARVRSFETAFRMQAEAPEAFDLSKETDETLALYGVDRKDTRGFGWQCLIARRLAERGVRFVELIDTGSANNWDSHGDMGGHEPLARMIDKPVAGLLADLKRRGMLADTLVVWTTEFGRTPGVDGEKGRGHHPACFSSWLAGGGVKAGVAYGKTDDIAATVAEDKVHVHDFHATILHLLGLDHEKLTYRHAGRDYRLTDVSGTVVRGVLA